MRNLQNYREIFREISNNLGLQGDSVELLVQLLANASYISEVENVAYMEEASLDRAVLMNSKIQHCIDLMYSVFRGSCPRVILNVKPTKYLSYSLYDELAVSNNFKVYYLGFWDSSKGDWNLSPVSIAPGSEPKPLLGLLAKETVSKTWVLSTLNSIYVNCTEDDLSNDLWVKIKRSGQDSENYVSNTRLFSDHVLKGYVFDLTLPSFGSRLYIPEGEANDVIEALYFKYSTLDSYNLGELKKISIKGAGIESFGDSGPFSDSDPSCIVPGIITREEGTRDDLISIHYKANRDRYLESIFRSNSDVSVMLEEEYPEKIYKGGVTYEFSTSTQTGESECTLYYVPKNLESLLSDTEKENFIESRNPYYVGSIGIKEGTYYEAVLSLDLELYRSSGSENLEESIRSILSGYSHRFDIDLRESEADIVALISKISNVKVVSGYSVTYIDQSGNIVNSDIDFKTSYLEIEPNLNTTIYSGIA